MKRIAIIGCGPSGIAAARVFSEDNNYNITIFERNSKIGGVWNYNKDENDDDIDKTKFYSPMYKSLKTNLPKELMYYPDMRHSDNIQESFLNHMDVLNYLKTYCSFYNLYKYIKFNSLIQRAEPVDLNQGTMWKVKYEDLRDNSIHLAEFDCVIVSVGLFENPRIPNIKGLKNFKGDIMHSKYYKVPEKYHGKSVCVLGARSSGMDISLQICDYADKVYLCHIDDPLLLKKRPKNLIEAGGIERIDEDGNIVITHLINNNKNGVLKNKRIKIKVDHIIFCTGYDMDLSFLSDKCGLSYQDGYLSPLYNHVVNAHYPDSMFVIGLGLEIPTFVTFYMQSKLSLACFKHEQNGSKQSDFLSIVQKKEAILLETGPPNRMWHYLGEETAFDYISELEHLSKSVMTVNIPKHLEVMFLLTKKWRLERTSQYRIVRLKLNDLNKLGFEIELPDDCDDEMKKEFEHDYEELLNKAKNNNNGFLELNK